MGENIHVSRSLQEPKSIFKTYKTTCSYAITEIDCGSFLEASVVALHLIALGLNESIHLNKSRNTVLVMVESQE